MCGFIGRINRVTADTALRRPLKMALALLMRRGPDSTKEWSSDDGHLELLFARLSVVDTNSHAHQPFIGSGERTALVFNGEIYNYRELKNGLKEYPFKTESDTEVIIALFEKGGIDALRSLRGMYAICIVDNYHKHIYLIRDPIGEKPLFFRQCYESIVFGSSALSLLSLNRGPVEINREIAQYFWERSFIPPHICAMKNIMPILPGQILKLDWNGDVIAKSHLEPHSIYVYSGETLPEVNKTIGSLIKTAVARCLTNNNSPTVLLSGGVDSTVICNIAHAACVRNGVNMRTLTLRSFIPWMNDEFYARYASHKIGIPLQLIRPTMVNMEDLIIKALDLQDEPLGMPSFFLLERLVSAAAEHSRILLTGDGGDEAFLGYGNPDEWHKPYRAIEEKDVSFLSGPPLPPWMSEWGQSAVTEVLVGHMLAKTDRASAEQGVELRSPLLDWDLLVYLRSLPFDMLTHGRRSKSLLKDQLSGWPRWFVNRQKVGFVYNLRWQWGLSNYAGLRENVMKDALNFFETAIPQKLHRDPMGWKASDIFQNFNDAWRLLAWSRFLHRLKRITLT